MGQMDLIDWIGPRLLQIRAALHPIAPFRNRPAPSTPISRDGIRSHTIPTSLSILAPTIPIRRQVIPSSTQRMSPCFDRVAEFFTPHLSSASQEADVLYGKVAFHLRQEQRGRPGRANPVR